MAGVTKPVPLPGGGGGPPLLTEASRAEQSRYKVPASVSQDSRGLASLLLARRRGVGSTGQLAWPSATLSDSRARPAPTHGSQARRGLGPHQRPSFVLCGHTYVLVNRWQLLNLPSALDGPATTQLLQPPGGTPFEPAGRGLARRTVPRTAGGHTEPEAPVTGHCRAGRGSGSR